MNKEEIEELKDFTIDLTDIDELALGLEVCSKKSNMVIQEFADTIIQLQQENQKLKDRDLIIAAELTKLQDENKILKENAENNDKVVNKVNWENMLLNKENKQLENNWNKLKEWLVQLQKFKGINQQGFSWGVAQEVLDKMEEIEKNI